MTTTTTESQINNPTFLVVDDERHIRQMGRDVLEYAGYSNILTAGSIEEAGDVLRDFASLLTTRDGFNQTQGAERPRLTFVMYKALGMLATDDGKYLSNEKRTEDEKTTRQDALLTAVTPEKEDAIIQGLSSYVIGLLDRQITGDSRVAGNHPCIDQHRIIKRAEDTLGPEHVAQKFGVISVSGLITNEEERQSVPAKMTVAAGPIILNKPFDIDTLGKAVDSVKQRFHALAAK